MIKTALFTNGKLSRITDSLKKIEKNSFRWIYASEPDSKEVEALVKDTGIRKSILLGYAKESTSRKYSANPLQFVIVDYFVEDGRVEKSKMLYVVTNDTLLIVIPKKTTYYENLFNKVNEEIKVISRATLANILYRFLEEDTEDNYEVLQENEKEIIKLEEKASKFQGEEIPAAQIVKFKRELFKMGRRFWATAKIIFLMRKGLTPIKLDQESRNLLEDTYDTFVHQIDVLSNQQEMLSDIMTIYSTKVSNEISKRVKHLTYVTLVLTGLTLVISIPNTVATIFGIPYFPHELLVSNWTYVVALLALSTVVSAAWLALYWNKHGVYKEKS